MLTHRRIKTTFPLFCTEHALNVFIYFFMGIVIFKIRHVDQNNYFRTHFLTGEDL